MCCFPDQVLVLLRANFPSRAINENDGNGRGALRDVTVMIRIMMIVGSSGVETGFCIK